MGFYGRRMVPEPLIKDLSKKRYIHYVTVEYTNYSYVIAIPNNSKKEITSDDILNFIKSLPDGSIYPVIQEKRVVLASSKIIIFYGLQVDNNQIKEKNYLFDFSNGALEDMTSVVSQVPIVSQYVL